MYVYTGFDGTPFAVKETQELVPITANRPTGSYTNVPVDYGWADRNNYLAWFKILYVQYRKNLYGKEYSESIIGPQTKVNFYANIDELLSLDSVYNSPEFASTLATFPATHTFTHVTFPEGTYPAVKYTLQDGIAIYNNSCLQYDGWWYNGMLQVVAPEYYGEAGKDNYQQTIGIRMVEAGVETGGVIQGAGLVVNMSPSAYRRGAFTLESVRADAFNTLEFSSTGGGTIDFTGSAYLVLSGHKGHAEAGSVTIQAEANSEDGYIFKGWRYPNGTVYNYTTEVSPGVFEYTFTSGMAAGKYIAIFEKPKTKLTVQITVSGRGVVKYSKEWGLESPHILNTHQIQPRTVAVDVPEGETLKITEITPFAPDWELLSTTHNVDAVIENDYDDQQSHTVNVEVVFKRVDNEEEEEDEEEEDDPDWPSVPDMPPGAGNPSVPSDRRTLLIEVDYQNGATAVGTLYTLGMVTGVSVAPDNPTRSTNVVRNLDYTLTFDLPTGDVITSVTFNGATKPTTNNITFACSLTSNTLKVTIHRVASRIITATVTNQIEPSIGEYNTLEIAPTAVATLVDGNEYAWGVNGSGAYTVTALPLLGYKLGEVICTPPIGNPYPLTIGQDGLSVDIPDDGQDLKLDFYFVINVVKITLSVKNWESEKDKFGLCLMSSPTDIPDPLPVGTTQNFVAGAYCGIYRRTGSAYADSTGVSRVLMRNKGGEEWIALAKPDSGVATWLGFFKVPSIDAEVEIVMYCTVNCSVGLPTLSGMTNWSEFAGYGKVRLVSLDPANLPTGDDGDDIENHRVAEMEALSDDYWPLPTHVGDTRPAGERPDWYPFVTVEIGAMVQLTATGGESDGHVPFYFGGFYTGYKTGYKTGDMVSDVTPYTFVVSGPEAVIEDADVPSETGGLVKVKTQFLSDIGVRYIRVALNDHDNPYARVRAQTNGTQITAEEYWRWRENDPSYSEWDDTPTGAVYFKFTDNDGSGEITSLQVENYGSASFFRWRKRTVMAVGQANWTLGEWQPTGSAPLLAVNLKPIVSMEYEIEFYDNEPPIGDPVGVTVGYSTPEDAEHGSVYYSKTNNPDDLIMVGKDGDYVNIEPDVPQGISFMLMAIPESGYVFLGWYDTDNNELSKASSWSPEISEQVHSFYAKFVVDIVPPPFTRFYVGYGDRFAATGADIFINKNNEQIKVPPEGAFYEWPTNQIDTLSLSVVLNTAHRKFWQWTNNQYSTISVNPAPILFDQYKQLVQDVWVLLLTDVVEVPEGKTVLQISTYPKKVVNSAAWRVVDVSDGGNTFLGTTSGRGKANFYVTPGATIRLTEITTPDGATLNLVYVDGELLPKSSVVEFTIGAELEPTDTVSVQLSYTLNYQPPTDRPVFIEPDDHGIFLLEGRTQPKKYVWRSKRFEFKTPDAPQSVKVWFDAENSDDKTAIVRLYGYTEPDTPLKLGANVSLEITGDNMRRVPRLRREHFWEFEIETDCPVKRLCIGTSAIVIGTGGRNQR